MDTLRIRKVSDILASYFDAAFVKKAEGYHQFYKDWSHFAGERCADHSRIETVVNNILVISVDHPAWIPLLQLKQHEILEKIKKQFPDLGIKGISFRVQSGQNSDVPEKDAITANDEKDIGEIPKTVEDTDDDGEGKVKEQSHAAEESVYGIESIKDDSLKAALERLGKSIQKRNGEDKKNRV